MPVLPDPINERIQWFEQRITAWKAAPTTIGLTAAQATALGTAITAARAAHDAAQAARIAAKNATIGQTSNVRTMSTLGADAISFIKAFANSQATDALRDAVYQAASVPPPAPATPPGPPTAPTMVTGDPNADGTVTLKWEGSTANQTFFTVWRKVGNNTQFFQVGAIATKKFVDDSVPSGTPNVTYFVRAQRNSEASPDSDQTVVNFGIAA